MILRFVLWNLADSKTTIQQLRRYLRDESVQRELPSRARELIGKDPDIGEAFDVEATIEGDYLNEQLSRLGLAFD